ncbi:MAG: RluA family pseudouridine synthase [Pseudomonadota bacterium]
MAEAADAPLEQAVPAELGGSRLDQAAAALFQGYSRSLLSRWIRLGALTVDGAVAKPKARLRGGERLRLSVTEVPYENWSEPQAMPLAVCYEDEDLLVLDKPAGLVVHPGAGNVDGTLVNGLLAYRPGLKDLPRAGIVHRLDKDTSGLMVVAGSLRALSGLSEAISARQVARHYRALALGDLATAQWIDAPLGRDPRQRTRQAVRADGRPARTQVLPQTRLGYATLVEARLETGRTHQIRVHLAHLGHPLLGDQRYGGRWPVRGLPARSDLALAGELSEARRAALAAFPRQALHAAELGLAHPVSGRALRFSAPLPADFAGLLTQLESRS